MTSKFNCTPVAMPLQLCKTGCNQINYSSCNIPVKQKYNEQTQAFKFKGFQKPVATKLFSLGCNVSKNTSY